MIYLRKANDRGHANHGWLDSWHTFSFANYYDPNFMGFSALRVINDDVIDAGQGFGTHPHKDMEILTYVLEGAVEHQDSMGNKEQVPAGEFQIMSAGTGIRHSEYNLEPETTRIFQIWIEPKTFGSAPSWGAKPFPKGDRSGKFVTLASGFADDADALPIRTDARVLGATLKAGESAEYQFADGDRYGYLVLAKGRADVNGVALEARDGAAVHAEKSLRVTASEDTEIVLVDAGAVH